jgi:hypothetical protein
MTAVMFLVLGAVLCFYGARSVRLAVLLAGFGGAWLLADELDASLATTVIVAVVGGLGALIFTLILSRFVVFVTGLILGAAVGAKLFELLDRGDASWLLAVVFIPSVALVCAFLAGRFRQPFLIWASAFAGAALILTGIGRIDTDPTRELHRPDNAVSAVVLAVLWIALGLAGRTVQARRTQPGRRRR